MISTTVYIITIAALLLLAVMKAVGDVIHEQLKVPEELRGELDNDQITQACGITLGIFMIRESLKEQNDNRIPFNTEIFKSIIKENCPLVQFVANGVNADKVLFHYKDGNSSQRLLPHDTYHANGYVLYLLEQHKVFSGFCKTDCRPKGVPYLSLMPEGHPELEEFYVDAE